MALSPRDLITHSKAELARREQASADVATGSFVRITDSGVIKAFGEEIAIVDARPGNDVRIRSISNNEATRVLKLSQVKPCLAIGDHVVTGDTVGTIGPVVNASGGIVNVLVDNWTDSTVGRPSSEVQAGVASASPKSAQQVRHLQSTTATRPEPPLSNACTYFVRHQMTEPQYAGQEIGPGTSAADFVQVAQTSDPCQPRHAVDTSLGMAVLCNFLGGATLWVWSRLLTKAAEGPDPWWELSPSHDHHPKLSDISQASLVNSSTAPAVEPTKEAKAMNTPKTKIDLLCEAPEPTRGSMFLLSDSYEERLREAILEIRRTWRDSELSLIDDEIDHLLGETEVGCGLFIIKTTQRIDLPDGRYFWVSKCSQYGSSDQNLYYKLAVGLMDAHGGGAIAQLEQAAQGGVIARTSKGLTRGVTDLARKSVTMAKDHVMDEAKRKAMAVADVATAESVLGGHTFIRDSILGAAAGLMGKDPATFASNPLLKHFGDKAGVGLLALMGSVADKVMPGAGDVLRNSSKTLEQTLDRKAAEQVFNAAAPMAANFAKALAAPVVARMMAPALPAAPVAAPAAIEAAPEDRPKPRKSRAKKDPAPAVATTPEAQAPKRGRKPKATEDGGAE